MKILMDCLLILISGFVFWQFAVIHEKGFWSCHLDFVPMVIASAVVVGIVVSGGLRAFLKEKIPFRNRIVGILTLAVGSMIFFMELVPAWFGDGDIYGHEPDKFVLIGELFLLGGIAVFGIINLVMDLIRSIKN